MNNTPKIAQPKSILCVDDDTDTCELLQFMLAEYDFVSSHSVEKAFELIESRAFDLYIFDNWLPDGTGIELCRRVRRSNSDAPIVFVSGAAHDTDIENALENGATRYLVKPCEPDLLKQVVKELIS